MKLHGDELYEALRNLLAKVEKSRGPKWPDEQRAAREALEKARGES